MLWPAFLDTARRIGGNDIALRFERAGDPTHDVAVLDPWYAMSDEERRDTWTACPAWWVHPAANTLDRATVSLPRLLYERMDELGIDFSIQYPSNALTFRSMADPELRTVGCRAVNTLHAEVYAPYADRMTPAAVVPSHTPEEAIAEAEYAVERLGLKVITLGHVLRPVPKLARERPDVAGHDRRLDALGVDSDHDYDPFWAKCIELGVAPTFHSGSRGWGSRRSVTNFSFNHIGHFSEGGTAICKSLFMAGVTRRFPELRTAFLEGGVSGACSLYAGIVGEWEKRNREALRAVDPSRLDGGALVALAGDYGDDRVRARLDALRAFYAHEASRPFYRDDWAALEVERGEQLRDLSSSTISTLGARPTTRRRHPRFLGLRRPEGSLRLGPPFSRTTGPTRDARSAWATTSGPGPRGRGGCWCRRTSSGMRRHAARRRAAEVFSRGRLAARAPLSLPKRRPLRNPGFKDCAAPARHRAGRAASMFGSSPV